MAWYSWNEDGFWCDFCGELLRAEHQFEDDQEWEDYEKQLEDGECPYCGVPGH